jgi:hypothetical protein
MSQAEYQSAGPEYLDALLSSKRAKNVFSLILLVCVGLQLAGFLAVQFTGLLDPLHATPAPSAEPQPAATTQPATQPATTPAATANDEREQAVYRAMFWSELLHWLMPATRFLALVTAILLCLTLLMCVKLSLLDRLGGVAGFISAFYWSLILLVVLVPWQQLLGGAFATGALSNYGEMIAQVKKTRPDWGADGGDTLGTVLHFARFLAYPALAVVLWLVAQVKFARGYQIMARACRLTPAPTVESGNPDRPPQPPAHETVPGEPGPEPDETITG